VRGRKDFGGHFFIFILFFFIFFIHFYSFLPFFVTAFFFSALIFA